MRSIHFGIWMQGLSACLCHLMIVMYDREQYASADILSGTVSQNFSADLIGPVWLSPCK